MSLSYSVLFIGVVSKCVLVMNLGVNPLFFTNFSTTSFVAHLLLLAQIMWSQFLKLFKVFVISEGTSPAVFMPILKLLLLTAIINP